MTDDQMVRLRGAVELLVNYAGGLDDPSVSTQTGPAGSGFGVRVEVYGKSSSPFAPPTVPTTAKQLALSVLLGDEAVLPQALADYLLDQGHEYATAVAEKARAEERERSAIAAMMLTHDRAEQLRALPLYEMEAVALDDHADWLRDRMMERA